MKQILGRSQLVQCAVMVLSIAFSASEVHSAAFTLGNLVVVQAGDGSAALSGNATAAFLSEFSISGGSPIQTIALPTTVSGLNQPLTLSGSATSEGFLTLSADGRYLTMSGYNATPGTAGVTAADPAVVNRVVGRISMSGVIDTTTALSDAFNGSNIRSAVSTDGNSLWAAGNAGSGQGATAGVKSTTFGSTTSLRLNDGGSNIRVVNIFNGQLYVSSSTGTFLGVSTVGTGLPTTGSQANNLVALPGMPTTGTHSSYDFWFKDANTLFVADDGSAANGGGIQKWTLSAGNWSLSYTLLNNGTTTTAVRGLAGTLNGNGDAVLFGTTGSALISVVDTGAGAIATTLATAPANTAFRGVEFLAQSVPEPSSMALVVLGGLALLGWRKRRQ